MKIDRFTDVQFNHILDVLIYYKKCNPKIDVYLNESSIKEAINYFMKTGMFEGLSDLNLSNIIDEKLNTDE
jgi:hypothetical protein